MTTTARFLSILSDRCDITATAAQLANRQLILSIVEGDVLFVRAWLQETDWDGGTLEVMSPSSVTPTLEHPSIHDDDNYHGIIEPLAFGVYGYVWISDYNINDNTNTRVVVLKMSPLHVAINENQVDILQALLLAAAATTTTTCVDDVLSSGCRQRLQTPLEFAVCANADPRIIESLLRHHQQQVGDADDFILYCRNSDDEEQQTLLMMAAVDDLTEVARVLLRHDASPGFVNAQDVWGHTALVLATTRRSRGVQSLLLRQHGVDVNVADNQCRFNALNKEILSGEPDVDVVRQMITRGADVEARSWRGSTALLLALRRCREEDEDESLQRRLDVVRVLLETGHAAVDVEDDRGQTPMFVASHFSRALRLLLQSSSSSSSGVNVNHANSRGETALHTACQVSANDNNSSDRRVRRLLHEFGADRHVKDTVHGRTPLHHAARAGNADAVMALLEGESPADADVMSLVKRRCTAYGRTALHELVWTGTRGPQPWLLQRYLRRINAVALADGDDGTTLASVVNAPDDRGWTPLHWACFRGDADAVRLLLSQSGGGAAASVRAVDRRGRTPLHVTGLTWIHGREWDESVDIPHRIMTSRALQNLSQEDWDAMRASDFRQHVTSFRGTGPPGGWFVTCDVARILLQEGGANPCVVDRDGNLPLFLAAVLFSDEHPELLNAVYFNLRAGAHEMLSRQSREMLDPTHWYAK